MARAACECEAVLALVSRPTKMGTNDFRSIKFCIYEAKLEASDGSGMLVNADADAHFRACLFEQNIKMHILSQCTLAPEMLKRGDKLTGDFLVNLIEGP